MRSPKTIKRFGAALGVAAALMVSLVVTSGPAASVETHNSSVTRTFKVTRTEVALSENYVLGDPRAPERESPSPMTVDQPSHQLRTIVAMVLAMGALTVVLILVPQAIAAVNAVAGLFALPIFAAVLVNARNR